MINDWGILLLVIMIIILFIALLCDNENAITLNTQIKEMLEQIVEQIDKDNAEYEEQKEKETNHD